MTQKAVLYIRVSSEEQADNTSMDSQERTGKEYAKRNNLDIVQIWRGPESAWKDDSRGDDERVRKNFNDMLNFVKENPDIKHLIFDVTDRMTRNEDDKIRIRKLIKQDGITVHFARSNKRLHKHSDSDDYFMFGIETLMAEKYSADLSKRIRKGMDSTVAMGRFPAIAPLGYLNNPVTKILDVDPVRAPFVQMAFRLKAYENKSIDEITEILYRKGLRSRKLGTKFPGNMKFVTSRVHKMLRDSFYYGEFKWNGNTYKGAYEPLISKELWDLTQEAFDGKKHKPRTNIFPYNGLVRCGVCGCSVIGGSYKKRRYEYYHCTFGKGKHADAPYITPAVLSGKFQKFLSGMSLPDDAFKALKKHLEANVNDDSKIKSDSLARLEAERKTLSDRACKLYDDRADGVIAESLWKRKNDEYQSRILEIERQVAGLKLTRSYNLAEGLACFELVKNILSLYNSLSDEKKGGFLRILLLNSVLNAENLDITVKNPFSLFLKSKKNPRWWRRWDLNPRPKLF